MTEPGEAHLRPKIIGARVSGCYRYTAKSPDPTPRSPQIRLSTGHDNKQRDAG